MSAAQQLPSYLEQPAGAPAREVPVQSRYAGWLQPRVGATKKPPYSAELDWRGLNREVLPEVVITGLQATYVIENRRSVAEFIAENRALRKLLLEAPDAIDREFGRDSVKTLTVLEDDEGSRQLFCLIMVPGEMDEARRALRSFDLHWWLDRSSHVPGKLNFDFELV
ncbi:MAG: hypothetical protein ABSG52_03395 [Terriglobales bacterium]|jgi:hypothetical protein